MASAGLAVRGATPRGGDLHAHLRRHRDVEPGQGRSALKQLGIPGAKLDEGQRALLLEDRRALRVEFRARTRGGAPRPRAARAGSRACASAGRDRPRAARHHILSRAGAALPDRIRRLAGWRQSHPHRVARLHGRLRARGSRQRARSAATCCTTHYASARRNDTDTPARAAVAPPVPDRSGLGAGPRYGRKQAPRRHRHGTRALREADRERAVATADVHLSCRRRIGRQAGVAADLLGNDGLARELLRSCPAIAPRR